MATALAAIVVVAAAAATAAEAQREARSVRVWLVRQAVSFKQSVAADSPEGPFGRQGKATPDLRSGKEDSIGRDLYRLLGLGTKRSLVGVFGGGGLGWVRVWPV